MVLSNAFDHRIKGQYHPPCALFFVVLLQEIQFTLDLLIFSDNAKRINFHVMMHIILFLEVNIKFIVTVNKVFAVQGVLLEYESQGTD